jgi:L-gulonate 3-dehydrogenase
MKIPSHPQVAIIGAGLIGRGWAVAFARAGCEVRIYYRKKADIPAAREWFADTLADLASSGLFSGDTRAVLDRIQCVDSLAQAVDGAGFVQECLPEVLEVKRAMFADLERLAPPDAILASSTSALPASHFTEALTTRSRCVVAHPANPPHLLPVVEIVPAPWTSDETIERTRQLLTAIGQVPILVRREVPGFVLNRLQAALIAEAWRLREDEVASSEDIDKAVRDGLGLRWAFMGPFETIDLNAPLGVADYAQRYGEMLYSLCVDMGPPRRWTDDLIARVEHERREVLPLQHQPERARWRDGRLMALRVLKDDF